MLALDDVESPDAGADVDSRALRHLFIFNFEVGHAQRFIAGGNGQVNKAPHLAGFFLFDDLERIEVLDLSRNTTGEGSGIEARNLLYAAFAGQDCLPHRVDVIADADTVWQAILA